MNHARFSAPVFARASGQPAEWETLLRLAAIAQGLAVPHDARAIDEQLFAEDVRRQFGDQAPAVLRASAGLHGPERLLDLALRHGPYQLDLARVKAAEDGLDLGFLMPRLHELLRTPPDASTWRLPICWPNWGTRNVPCRKALHPW